VICSIPRVHRQRHADGHLGVARHPVEILAERARSSASALVANRVCTTERSSAKSSTTASVASVAAGCAPSAVITVVRPATARSRSRTSVVVPERVIATIRS
jgi:hypothetical protein